MIATLAAFGLVAVAPTSVDAQAGARSTKSAKAKRVRVASATRSPRQSGIGQNGLCQRDNGIPDSQLDFRNRCHVEEFWARNMERAGDVGR